MSSDVYLTSVATPIGIASPKQSLKQLSLCPLPCGLTSVNSIVMVPLVLLFVLGMNGTLWPGFPSCYSQLQPVSLPLCVWSQQWYGFFTLAGLCSYCRCDLPLTHLQLLSILLCRLHTLCHINVLCQSNVLQEKAHLCISTLGCTLVCLVGPLMDSP